MKGKPKFKLGENVKFKINNDIKKGSIFVVDKYGTFEDKSDVSYDILVESENCLYKHITEKLVEKDNESLM